MAYSFRPDEAEKILKWQDKTKAALIAHIESDPELKARLMVEGL